MAQEKTAAMHMGEKMWQALVATFVSTAEANGITEHQQQLDYWCGFIGSASGSMAAQVGESPAADLLQMLASIAAEHQAKPPRSELH